LEKLLSKLSVNLDRVKKTLATMPGYGVTQADKQYGENSMGTEKELIVVSKNKDITIIRPVMKRLDASVALSFKEAVLKAIDTEKPMLVLNMESVQFMDSSGLGSVVSVLKALGSRGRLAVCNANSALLSLFKLTRMDKVFTIAGSVDDATLQLDS
jgi:anti-sigma B factor antagonist